MVASDLEVDLERLEQGDMLGDGITPPLEVAGSCNPANTWGGGPTGFGRI